MLVELTALTVVVACLLVCGASRPADAATLRRDAARRLRFVQAHPGHVNGGDIDRLVSLEVSPEVASFLAPVVAARGLDPVLLWSLAQSFEPRGLALAVAAGLPESELRACLERGALPATGELAMFAAVNGMPELPTAPEPATRPSRPPLLDVLNRTVPVPSFERS